MQSEAFDRDVRWQIFDSAMRNGTPASSADIARELRADIDDVRASFQRLADGRIVVLQRDSGEILMANPFSTVPTPFVVETDTWSAYSNCIWDAMGIAAMVHRDAKIVTSCADCGTAAEVVIEGDRVRGEGLVHFAIPAREWWSNIVFT